MTEFLQSENTHYDILPKYRNMANLPVDNNRYKEVDYWNERYTAEQSYDWLGGFPKFQHLLEQHVKKEDSILMLGQSRFPPGVYLLVVGLLVQNLSICHCSLNNGPAVCFQIYMHILLWSVLQATVLNMSSVLSMIPQAATSQRPAQVISLVGHKSLFIRFTFWISTRSRTPLTLKLLLLILLILLRLLLHTKNNVYNWYFVAFASLLSLMHWKLIV